LPVTLDRSKPLAKLFGIDPVFPVIEQHSAIESDEALRLFEKRRRNIAYRGAIVN
jgi:hypothetical protein